MRDVTIALENRPGALAEMGEAPGRAGLSIEGGGAFVLNGDGVSHFLLADGTAARKTLEAVGIGVPVVREVLVQRLDQSLPGQLGEITRQMARAGVNIEVLYSDHDRQPILAVDDMTKGRLVSQAWRREEQVERQHAYEVQVTWTGNDGDGTKTYRAYRRDHVIAATGKPEVPGSSAPGFRGDPARYNPEEMLVASLSACHMLWYLHLCSVNRLTVVDYHDSALGLMREAEDGSGDFVRVLLKPVVTISEGDPAQALALHERAHRHCFIARSVKFPVEIEAQIVEATAAG